MDQPAGPDGSDLGTTVPMQATRHAIRARKYASLQVHGSALQALYAARKILSGKEAAYLRSAVAGRQWPQARAPGARNAKWAVGASKFCQLCHLETGTLLHRHNCPATRPCEGWEVPTRAITDFMRAMPHQQADLLWTRGLGASYLPPRPQTQGTLRWIRELSEQADAADLTW